MASQKLSNELKKYLVERGYKHEVECNELTDQEIDRIIQLELLNRLSKQQAEILPAIKSMQTDSSFRISPDVHSLKNMVIFFMILTIANIIATIIMLAPLAKLLR